MDNEVWSLRRSDLTEEYVRATCRPGEGHACCRYLTFGLGGWDCQKHKEHRELLDFRVASETMVARGDNCGGVTDG